MKQIKLITLNDFDPDNSKKYPFSEIENIGRNKMPCMISGDILSSIIKTYQLEGEKEVIRMIDRGQISTEDAQTVLGERFVIVSTMVDVE